MRTIREELERFVIEREVPDGHYEKVPLLQLVDEHVEQAMMLGLTMDDLRHAVAYHDLHHPHIGDWDPRIDSGGRPSGHPQFGKG